MEEMRQLEFAEQSTEDERIAETTEICRGSAPGLCVKKLPEAGNTAERI